MQHHKLYHHSCNLTGRWVFLLVCSVFFLFQHVNCINSANVNNYAMNVTFQENILAKSQAIQFGNILSVFPSVVHENCFYFSHALDKLHSIMRVNLTSGDVETIYSIVRNPSSLFVSKSVEEGVSYDQIYFIDKAGSSISRFDTKTKSATRLVTKLVKPLRLVVNRGNVYFADSNRILAFNLTSNELRTDPIATFNLNITSLTINLDTNVIFAVLQDDSLYSIQDKINSTPQYLFSMNITISNENPSSLTTNPKTLIRTSTKYQDELFAFCYNRIFKLYKNGTSQVIVGSGKVSNVHSFGPVLQVELAHIVDMYIGSNIYIAYRDSILSIINGNLRKIFSKGGVSLDGLSNLKYGFSNIEKITISPRYRNLYVTDGNIIRNISLSTGIVTSIESSSAEISSSYNVIYTEIDVDHQENLYVTSIDPETSVTSLAVIKNDMSYSVLIDSSKQLKHIDGMDAENAILNIPEAIVKLESTGDIYFSESGSHTIKKITKNGKIYIVAGMRESGYSGDGGLAINARLNAPKGITLVDNTIYVCDSKNGVIRNMSLETGLIGTFAGYYTPDYDRLVDEIPLDGKPRHSIKMNNPLDLEYSKNYNALFVSDAFNHRILKFPFKEDRGYLFAGTGYRGYLDSSPLTSKFDEPYGLLCLDDTITKVTQLYIVDSSNHKVRKITIQNDLISNTQTIAGKSDGYGGDGGSALNANLLYPKYVEYFKGQDGTELLFISDTFNNRVRMINLKSNYISTAIGLGSSGFNRNTSPDKIKLNSPKGLFVSGEVLYFSDSRNNRILGLNMTGGDFSIKTKQIAFVAGGHGTSNVTERMSISYPSSVVSDPNVIYFADDYFSIITKLDKDGKLTTYAGDGDIGRGNSEVYSPLNKPTALMIDSKGNLIFCDMLNDRIRKIEKNKVVTIADKNLEGPFSLIFNHDNDLIVLHQFGRRISLINSNNQEKTLATLKENAFDIEFDPVTGSILYNTQSNVYSLTPVCGTEGYKLNENFTSCLPVCYGKTTEVCNGNGQCIAPDQCMCQIGYQGRECEVATCNGLTNQNKNVCNGRGTCQGYNSCKCNSELYLGSNCEIATCFEKIHSLACGGPTRGNCSDIDKCSCKQGSYSGDECQLVMCNGIAENDPDVCSGSGICTSVNTCKCNGGSDGDFCANKTTIIAPIVLVIVFSLLVILLVCLLLFLYRKYGKQKKIIGDTNSLSKQLLFGDDYVELQDPRNSETPDYIVPVSELNLSSTKKLGSGGQGMVVGGIWKGIDVAVKIFEMDSDIQDNEFANEVKILVNLRHPNCVSFFCCSITPKKGFIVMERLSKSLGQVIYELEKGIGTMSIHKKLQMILGIGRGIEYLHSLKPRPIVHRDLKPGNVLLDENGVCKLCDFGFSRKMSDHSSAMTHLIGTYNYMSPEMMTGSFKDAKSCDIYAFAIIMWQLLFECQDAYSYTEMRTLKKFNLSKEQKYASTPLLTGKICNEHLRPLMPFNTKEECIEWCESFLTRRESELDSDKMFLICNLIKECWRSDEEKRPPIMTIVGRIESIINLK